MPSLCPQPLQHPFDHPVIEMKAVPLKSQDGKCTSVYFKTKLHLHMGAEGGENVPYWLLRRPVRAEDRPFTSVLPSAWGSQTKTQVRSSIEILP